MRHFLKAVLLFVLLILQSTVCRYLEIMNITPNLMLAFMVAAVLTSKSISEAGIYGFVTGLVYDLVWGRVFGIETLLFMYLALLLFYISEYMYKKNLFLSVWLTFLTSVIAETVVFVLCFVIFGKATFWYTFFARIIPCAAYTALAEIIVYEIAVKIPSKRKV